MALAYGDGCPMYYPYWPDKPGLRERLIGRKVFVPTYWPNVLAWAAEHTLEHRLAREVLPLPIDQRYGAREMEFIIEVIDAG